VLPTGPRIVGFDATKHDIFKCVALLIERLTTTFALVLQTFCVNERLKRRVSRLGFISFGVCSELAYFNFFRSGKFFQFVRLPF